MAKKKAPKKAKKDVESIELSDMPSDELALEQEQPELQEMDESELGAHKAKLASDRKSRKVPKKLHKFK